MTAFRQTVEQPESYLKTTLPMIADQIRSGTYNNHWKLKPEAELQNVQIAAAQLEGNGASSAAESGDDDDDEDDDEDDLQMEDVGL